jgi:hypothetical protein
MEKNRLNTVLKYVFLTSKWYLRIMHIIFFIWAVLVMISVTDIDNIRNFCLYGMPSELDRILVKDNECQVDWMYFVKEPIAVITLVYFFIILPVFVIYFFLRRKFSENNF